jgi:hypothetical protein
MVFASQFFFLGCRPGLSSQQPLSCIRVPEDGLSVEYYKENSEIHIAKVFHKT